MITMNTLKRTRVTGVALLGALILCAGGAVRAQDGQPAIPKVAVIDSDRIVAESVAGQAALEGLKTLREAKMAEGTALQNSVSDLQKRVQDGRLSLSEERLEELNAELEEKLIAFRRFSDDAERQLANKEKEALQKIERQILEVIGQIGREQGYSMVFNKFRSGLVYADDALDITGLVIERFNLTSQAGQAGN